VAKPYFDVVKHCEAKVFVNENVPQLLIHNHKAPEHCPDVSEMGVRMWPKYAVLARIKKTTKRKVKSLASWQVHRKNMLGIG